MKIYQVGGSLRDELLGLPVADRDWVVVGATPQAMIETGFKPVGRDFPVFLHPDTHEEYALARTERKTAPGYAGFVFHAAPDVTLEQDLARRDFTVNAMARDAGVTGAPLIDPFNGRADLAARLLRHVSPAFAEDPVRILRAARFVARFGFGVAPQTSDLMRAMVAAGEVDALVPERVWQEVARGLSERDPVAMFATLDGCGALARVMPELAPWDAVSRGMLALAAAARLALSLPMRFAAACASLDEVKVAGLCERLRAPSECRDLALLYARHRKTLGEADSLGAGALAELVREADGLRQPGRFLALVAVAHVAATADGMEDAYRNVVKRLTLALNASRGIDAGAIARTQSTPAAIQAALRLAREHAVAQAIGRT